MTRWGMALRGGQLIVGLNDPLGRERRGQKPSAAQITRGQAYCSSKQDELAAKL